MIKTITWVLPRPRKNKYRGGFPLHFEKKLIRELGMNEIRDTQNIFHSFGGCAEYGIKNDIKPELKPMFNLDAHNLHLIKNNTFQLVILDPPYNEQQSKELYGTPKPRYKDYIKEAVRVCKPKGFVAIYHWVMTPRPEGTKYFMRIVILTRVWHKPRVCCVFQKEK